MPLFHVLVADVTCGTFASDMNHSNMYAVGLALCTFANIASEEMSRDLVNEIEKLLGSSNTYIRKKVRRMSSEINIVGYVSYLSVGFG